MAMLNDLLVVRPTTLTQALAELHAAVEHGQPVRPMAGCTDLLVDAHFGKTMPLLARSPAILDTSNQLLNVTLAKASPYNPLGS